MPQYPTSHLCEKCTGVSTNWLWLLNGIGYTNEELTSSGQHTISHFTELKDIADSADKHGCALCIELLNCVMSHNLMVWTEDFLEAGVMRLDTHYNEDVDGFLLSVNVCCCTWGIEDIDPYDHDQVGIQWECMTLMINLMPVDTSSDLIKGLNFKDSYNTQDTIPLITSWLQACQENHPECQISDSKFLPSRLIQVDLDHPKLTLSSTLEIAPHATLSHCWGNSNFTTLNTVNLEAFQTRISETALSKTFCDAISVARQLAIRYIWIDSLCIVQDDPQDWERESLVMSSVYTNSTINIAATAAMDGNYGLFVERAATSVCQISMCESTSEVYHAVAKYTYEHTFKDMPLLKRGWTLQERLLPSRTVHFTNTEVFWECFANIACESAPLGVHCFAEVPSDQITFYNKKPFTYSLWAWAVEVYSRAKVTVESDKLVAISGLAKRIHSQNGIRYIAGLWDDELLLGLLWKADPLALSPTRSDSYLAPSWSWASCSGAVDFSNLSLRTPSYGISFAEATISIISAAVEPPDSFAQVTAGTLEIESRFLATIELQNGKTPRLQDAWEDLLIRVYMDSSERISDAFVYLLPVHFYESSNVIGLLLIPTRKNQGEFYRAGMFMMSQASKSFDPQSGLSVRSSLPWSFFRHSLENVTSQYGTDGEARRYYITIV